MNVFPLVLVFIVLLATAARTYLPFKIEIWAIMLFAAILAVLSRSIGIMDAAKSISLDVMLFLFFMFILGEVLEESGFLYVLEYKIFSGAKSRERILLYAIFSMALLSYFFMNDTIAVIGTPLMLFLAKRHSMNHKMLLLTLAFSITIGSVASPIGNPQNLLIAVRSGINEPFSEFAKYLLIPSAINLFALFIVIKIFYREEFEKTDALNHEKREVGDYAMYGYAKVSVLILVIVLIAWILSRFLFRGTDIPLYAIPILPALYGLASSKRKKKIIGRIDYKTLLFFAGMFVLMKALYINGEPKILFDAAQKAVNVPTTLALSIFISQIISNVPFVALFLDAIKSTGGNEILMALAAGSTIAGNLFILGAASNVIIIQRAEREGKTLSFLEFSKCGILLTVVNFLVYWAYFSLI
ncbi:MAG: SLC13 family permease [bacterium]|nr:SLC13 family permease [bacterium]